MRHAIHGDAERAAPGMVDTHIGQLRKDFRQRLAYLGSDVVREPVAVALGAAEEQAVVFREAEIVDDELAVGNGEVVPDDACLPLGAQGFGCNDEVVDGHDTARHVLLERAEVAVATEHHMACPDRGIVGLHGCRVATRNVHDA